MGNLFFLKLTISSILVYITIKDIDYNKLNKIFFDIDIKFIILALILQFMLSLILTFRWKKIAEFLKLRLKFLKAWNNVLIGLFFNQTLPSTIGGDAVRILLLSEYGYKIAFKSILIDRIFALFASSFICVFGYFFLTIELIKSEIYFHIIFLIPSAFILILLTSIIFESYVSLFKIEIFLKKIGVISLLKDFKLVICNPKISISAVFYSVIIQLTTVLSGFLILKSMSVDIEFFLFCILFVSVILISTIPISIAGWGVRENLMVLMMNGLGLSNEISLSLSIIFGLVMLLVGLPGGLLFLNKKVQFGFTLTDFMGKIKSKTK